MFAVGADTASAADYILSHAEDHTTTPATPPATPSQTQSQTKYNKVCMYDDMLFSHVHSETVLHRFIIFNKQTISYREDLSPLHCATQHYSFITKQLYIKPSLTVKTQLHMSLMPFSHCALLDSCRPLRSLLAFR